MNLSEIQIQSVDNICKLPEDVLIEIFSNLTLSENTEIRSYNRNLKSDLLNAALVCKQWNRIISETVELMDKLRLDLVSCIKEDQLKFQKRHRHVRLYGGNFNRFEKSASLLFCLDSLQKSLTSVTIGNVYADDVDFDLLNSLSTYQLSSLEFEDIHESRKKKKKNWLSDDIKTVEFKNLNHLRLNGNTSCIL